MLVLASEIVYSLQNLSYDLTEGKTETPFVSAFANYTSNKKSEGNLKESKSTVRFFNPKGFTKFIKEKRAKRIAP